MSVIQRSKGGTGSISPGRCLGYRLHWVCDVTFDEDHSQVRTGNGPRIMASLRILAISIMRLAGANNIVQTLRHHAWDPLRLVALLLTS